MPMERRKYSIIVAGLGLVFGIGLGFWAAVMDPFSIPFQDFEHLADEVKAQHERESQQMTYLSRLGFLLSLVSAIVFFVQMFRR